MSMVVDVPEIKSLLSQECSPSYDLFAQESYIPKDLNHRLNASDTCNIKTGNTERFHENWRLKITEWAFEVTDHFGFQREVVSICMNFIDRYMAYQHRLKRPVLQVSKSDFQLLAITSLFLAMKLHGEACTASGLRKRIKIQVFAELSRGQFDEQAIERMECELLHALEWKVHPPTPATFLAYYLLLLPDWDTTIERDSLYEVARYMTELSVCMSDFTFEFKPSVTALSAILCALENLGRQSDGLAHPPPYVLHTFFQNILDATGLVPQSLQVLQCRNKLRMLCPQVIQMPRHQHYVPPPLQPSRVIVVNRLAAAATLGPHRHSALVSPSSSNPTISPISCAEHESLDYSPEGRKRTRSRSPATHLHY